MADQAQSRPKVSGMRSRKTRSGKAGSPLSAPIMAVPDVGPVPAGWRVVGGKEFGEHLLSIRFIALLLILGLVGIFVVSSAAGNFRDLANQLNSSTGVFLALFAFEPQTSFAQIPSFVSFVGFLGPLLGIVFGFDAISSERAEGTLPRLVSQPIHRDDVINGKFLAGITTIGVTLAAVMLVLAGVGLVRIGIVPTGDDAVRLFVWFMLTVLYIGFWLALATLCSVVFRRPATAAIVVIAVWLVTTIFGGLLFGLIADTISPAGTEASAQQQLDNATIQQEISRISPKTLFDEMSAVLLNPRLRSLDVITAAQADRAIPTILPVGQSVLIIWPQIVALTAETAVCFAAAYVVFMRQEVRA